MSWVSIPLRRETPITTILLLFLTKVALMQGTGSAVSWCCFGTSCCVSFAAEFSVDAGRGVRLGTALME